MQANSNKPFTYNSHLHAINTTHQRNGRWQSSRTAWSRNFWASNPFQRCWITEVPTPIKNQFTYYLIDTHFTLFKTTHFSKVLPINSKLIYWITKVMRDSVAQTRTSMRLFSFRFGVCSRSSFSINQCVVISPYKPTYSSNVLTENGYRSIWKMVIFFGRDRKT